MGVGINYFPIRIIKDTCITWFNRLKFAHYENRNQVTSSAFKASKLKSLEFEFSYLYFLIFIIF
jgi:hypothetical protein